MPKKKETLVRKGNVMAQPDGGWLHNESALARGAGVFFSFPVKYLGSIQVLKSLSGLTTDVKTEIIREGIARTAEAAKARKHAKRKTPKLCKEYLADSAYVKPMELKLNLSADGFATSDLNSQQIISHDPIAKISFAAGGEKLDYYFVTYVAKDKRNNRYCHVFDCGKLADDVLATFGQIFNIIQTKKKSKPPSSSGAPPALPTTPRPSGAVEAMDGQSNPMYWQGAAAISGGPSMMGEASDMPEYGEVVYDNYEAAPEEPPRPPKPQSQIEDLMYDDMVAGEEVVSQLRVLAPSSVGMYGDEDDPDTAIYGDGQAGWEYLKMDAEETYGDLVEFATS